MSGARPHAGCRRYGPPRWILEWRRCSISRRLVHALRCWRETEDGTVAESRLCSASRTTSVGSHAAALLLPLFSTSNSSSSACSDLRGLEDAPRRPNLDKADRCGAENAVHHLTSAQRQMLRTVSCSSEARLALALSAHQTGLDQSDTIPPVTISPHGHTHVLIIALCDRTAMERRSHFLEQGCERRCP